jgi:Cellulase (glycosyl hydrolase family 5)
MSNAMSNLRLTWVLCLVTAACSATPTETDAPGITGAGTFAAGSSAGAQSAAGMWSTDASAGTAGSAWLDASITAVDPDAGAADAAVSGIDPGGSLVPGSLGYLHTDGARIVDSSGNTVRLTGINWFGMETSNHAPHGLWSRSLGSMLDQVVSLGYNMLRLPFSSQFLDAGSMPNGIDYAMNPDLMGLAGLALLDELVSAAGERGLRVVLGRHRPDSNAQSNLWYTTAYDEQRWHQAPLLAPLLP